MQCCCPRGKPCPPASSRTNLQVLVLVIVLGPQIPRKLLRARSAFNKQTVMCDHVKSIKSVTASVLRLWLKNGLLIIDIRYYLPSDNIGLIGKSLSYSSRIPEDEFTSHLSLSLFSDFKSLSLRLELTRTLSR